MGVIFYFSTRPTAGVVSETVPRFLFFKTLHLIEYAVLTFLLYFAFSKNKITLITAYLYSLSDEIHQTFISGRSGRFRDILIDLIGIIIALYLIKYFRSKKSG